MRYSNFILFLIFAKLFSVEAKCEFQGVFQQKFDGFEWRLRRIIFLCLVLGMSCLQSFESENIQHYSLTPSSAADRNNYDNECCVKMCMSGVMWNIRSDIFPLLLTSFAESEEDDIVLPVRYYPESLSALSKATRFSEDEIKRMYRSFKSQCPTGFIREDTFKDIYSQFFPFGGW